MKIAVNTRFLIKDKLEGIGWFTHESLKRITQQHPEHDFIFFFDRPFSDEFIFSKNILPRVLFPPARHPLLWWWWFEVAVPSALRKWKPDVFLSPDGYASLSTNCRQVTVIHDLAFEHFTDQLPANVLKYYKRFVPQYARKANRIATVSQFSKKDIVDSYGISPEKIDVVYNGSNELFRVMGMEEKKQTKRKFTYGSDYFIYAGAIQPRKNIVNLLKAFDEFRKNNSSGIKLVLAGRNWSYGKAMQVHSNMQFKEEVIFIGHLTRKQLSQLMGAALALVYVSLFEGFGIPIIEAMNCDVPVITSNVSSMPEVAGDAALLVDPNNLDDIAAKMKIISQDEELRNHLIMKGRLQREKFSWQQTADRLWDCIMKTMR